MAENGLTDLSPYFFKKEKMNMAKYVVPSSIAKNKIIKCHNCKSLYVYEKMKFPGSQFVEACPVCGFDSNSTANLVPLWKYNLIKWFRGGFKNEK